MKRGLGRERLSFFDAFSGSGVVARFMKQHSSLIVANDLEPYSEAVNRCFLTNRSTIDAASFHDAFNAWVAYTKAHPVEGVLAQHYAPRDDGNIRRGERAFYTRANAVRLDSARAALDVAVPPEYRHLLLGPLLAEASIHANTSGVFKGFYKNRRGVGEFGGEGRNALTRICGEVRLQKPVLSRFDCESLVLRGDANEVAEGVGPVDLAYFDPPYNQHPYGSNYFMLNLIAANRPAAAASRVSGIPADWNRSKYNVRSLAEGELFSLLAKTRARFLMISYNSEGFIKKEAFLKFLERLGEVESVETEYNAFRGSRNLRTRSLKVTEYLFVVRKRRVA